jgi:hypothetical protein
MGVHCWIFAPLAWDPPATSRTLRLCTAIIHCCVVLRGFTTQNSWLSPPCQSH